nr:MAG TPA: hypothetical protein [Caudoviricetes sp.]
MGFEYKNPACRRNAKFRAGKLDERYPLNCLI